MIKSDYLFKRIVLPMMFAIAFLKGNSTVYIVTDGSDLNDNTVPYSLRDAISLANSNPGIDNIQFNISPSGTHSIQLTNNDLIITEGVIIDGTTQPGYNAGSPTPVIEVWGSGGNNFYLSNTAVNTTIKAICINRASQNGIYVSASNFSIQGCIIGLNPSGTAVQSNSQIGINFASGVGSATIGGGTQQDRNIISGNGQHGIQLFQGSTYTITGNYIGTDITGLIDLGNGSNGIEVYQTSNVTIGGSSSSLMNILSGNNQFGIEVQTGSNVTIRGNYVGIGSDGSAAIGNSVHGILIFTNSNSVQVGGSGNGDGNVISCNGSIGINCITSTAIIIKQNYVGVSANGLVAKGNGNHGIQVQSCPGTVIGGDRTTEGNIISNNAIHGINYDPSGDGGIIQGNFIGTDKNGTAAFGNAVINIVAKSDNMIIGGNTSNLGNIIVDAKNATVGTGILIANANNSVVRNNFIGVALDGVTTLGNKTCGINISVEDPGMTAQNNTIQYNTIAYNGGYGVSVGDALPMEAFGGGGYVSSNVENSNLIIRNSIYCNSLKGINLNLGSADNGNSGHITPSLNSSTATSAFIEGTAMANDSIHIYSQGDCSNCSQGKNFIAAIKADASGYWSYTSSSAFSGQTSVTATDASNNTSEFADCVTILPVVFINTSAVHKDGMVLITWSTSEENSNNYFEVQRSLDGINFSTIGIVNGRGNSNININYSFTDHYPYEEGAYYRIRQVDFDGKSSFSKVVSVIGYGKKSTCYYNKDLNSLIINSDFKIDEVLIYNSLGQFVFDKRILNGEKHIEIGLALSGRGYYVVEMKSGEGSFINKIIF